MERIISSRFSELVAGHQVIESQAHQFLLSFYRKILILRGDHVRIKKEKGNSIDRDARYSDKILLIDFISEE